MTPTVPFPLTLTDVSGSTNRLWAVWRCNQKTSIRKQGCYYLWAKATDILAEQEVLLMTVQLLFLIRVEMCAGKTWYIPGERCGYPPWLCGQYWWAGVAHGHQERWWGVHLSKDFRLGCASHCWLWHKSHCLQNTELALGATTTREQTKQVLQIEGRVEMVLMMSTTDLLTVNCCVTELQSWAQAAPWRQCPLSWGWGPGNKCTGTLYLMAALGQRSKN